MKTTPKQPTASAAQYPALAGVTPTALALVWQAWNHDGIAISGARSVWGMKAAERAGLFYFTRETSHIEARQPGEFGRYMLTRRGLAIGLALDDAACR